jgi:hypothetical protein
MNEKSPAPNMREPCRSDCLEIVLRYPCIPVLLEHLQCDVIVHHFSERELIHDRRVICRDKYAGRNPWLHTKNSRSVGDEMEIL